MKKRIAILGSTGSIGKQTLDLVDWFPDRLEVVALTARTDLDTLKAQIDKHRPQYAAITDPKPLSDLSSPIGSIQTGQHALVEAASLSEADLVIVSVVGTAGLAPALAALEAGKSVALATKEALVVGGHLMTAAAAKSGATILPIDSEHSAIWQCLRGNELEEVEKIVLTASGGPFVDATTEQMAAATIQNALNHPTWNMGGKITIDSATLMNKGLEVIEARWLFGLPASRIEVVVHRQSIIHSLVYFRDSSVVAQLGCPDMRMPIQYSLFYPERLPNELERLDLVKSARLTFEPPDIARFPALRLAFEAAETAGSLPGVMSAANEVAVDAFLAGKTSFPAISATVERVMSRHNVAREPGLAELLDLDAWARREAAAG